MLTHFFNSFHSYASFSWKWSGYKNVFAQTQQLGCLCLPLFCFVSFVWIFVLKQRKSLFWSITKIFFVIGFLCLRSLLKSRLRLTFSMFYLVCHFHFRFIHWLLRSCCHGSALLYMFAWFWSSWARLCRNRFWASKVRTEFWELS